jgi:transcriptional regulator with XRE-family HTH domain
MSKKKISEVKAKVDALCGGVKEIRQAYSDSQEAFARRIGVSSMTISRFELGKQVPRDPLVLWRLYQAAVQAPPRLDSAIVPLFAEALHREIGPDWHKYTETWPVPNRQARSYTLSEWRLQSVARIAAKYFFEEAAAIELSAPSSTALVDSVLRDAHAADQIDDSFYEYLDQRLSDLAEKTLLQRFQEKRK